jgi:hypothetical protein
MNVSMLPAFLEGIDITKRTLCEKEQSHGHSNGISLDPGTAYYVKKSVHFSHKFRTTSSKTTKVVITGFVAEQPNK